MPRPKAAAATKKKTQRATRYGFVSDIHSNLVALKTVIAAIDEMGVDQIVCLGDIVGYGPNPNECIDLLRRRRCTAIMGNHDEAIVDPSADESFNDLARAAIEWTRHALTPENTAYLAALPDSIEFDDFAIIHGAPGYRFAYLVDAAGAAEAFRHVMRPLTFVGHTHVAEVYLQNAARRTFHERLPNGGRIAIEPEFRYIVNPGSVGQPRDYNPLASFAVYDQVKRTVDVRRVEYDIARVRRLIDEAQLPEFLGARLELGA